MNTFFTKIAAAFCLLSSVTFAQVTESFDNLSLPLNSFYQNANGNDWQTTAASPMIFSYGYNGGWSSGFAYTNMKDTVDGTSANLYASVTYTPFDGTNYVTGQNGAVIKLVNDANFINTVSGFFVTNTTHVYKTLKSGSATSRKFGDTTGTYSGDTVLQGEYPDWLKLQVRGFRNGTMTTDSIEFYLADFRPALSTDDYIIKDWRYVNCTTMGYNDSLVILMTSSDTTNHIMNTPGYFSIDRVTTVNTINVSELEAISDVKTYPNPTDKNIFINYIAKSETELQVSLYDVYGKMISKQKQQAYIGNNTIHLSTDELPAGVYMIELSNGKTSKKIKFIKQ